MDSLRRLAAIDLDAAYQRVGEGEHSGELSKFESADLCAHLTYQYTDNYALAMDYCRKALSALGNEDDEPRVETLYLLSTIAEAGKDFQTCINACTEGKEVAHRNKMKFEEHSFDYLVGKCKLDMGLKDEGLALMSSSIDKAIQVVDGEGEYGHLIYFVNNLIACYIAVDNMEDVLRESDLLERLINEMEAKYPQAKPYCDQCRFDLHSYRAIAKITLGRPQEAEADFDQALAFDFAKSYPGSDLLLRYYAAAGNVDSVLNLLNRFPYQENDTVQRLYCRRLMRLEQAYRVAGDTAMANLYQCRIDTLSQLIDRNEQEQGVAVNAAQYETQQYKMELDDLSKFTKKTFLLLFLLTVVLAFVSLAFHRINKRKAAKAEEKMKKLQKQVNIIARDYSQASPQATKPVARSLTAFVEEQQLYLNKDLSRALVAKMMGCSHQTITKMLNEIQPDLSFPDYIKGLRIAYALKLIKENPGLTVQQIADQSGFYSISNFERAFKTITGKTPREYLKGQSSSDLPCEG
ncbi:MAG: helix-turn-helix domain-containing protein [Bacteroidales bacterium]|nr:helix-turn-helix domain-containing protein [Bacteroidales bacterium]